MLKFLFQRDVVAAKVSLFYFEADKSNITTPHYIYSTMYSDFYWLAKSEVQKLQTTCTPK